MGRYESIKKIEKCYHCDDKAEYTYFYKGIFKTIVKTICNKCRIKYVNGKIDLKK